MTSDLVKLLGLSSLTSLVTFSGCRKVRTFSEAERYLIGDVRPWPLTSKRLARSLTEGWLSGEVTPMVGGVRPWPLGEKGRGLRSRGVEEVSRSRSSRKLILRRRRQLHWQHENRERTFSAFDVWLFFRNTLLDFWWRRIGSKNSRVWFELCLDHNAGKSKPYVQDSDDTSNIQARFSTEQLVCVENPFGFVAREPCNILVSRSGIHKRYVCWRTFNIPFNFNFTLSNSGYVNPNCDTSSFFKAIVSSAPSRVLESPLISFNLGLEKVCPKNLPEHARFK